VTVLDEHLLHQQVEEVLFLWAGDGADQFGRVDQDLLQEIRIQLGEVRGDVLV